MERTGRPSKGRAREAAVMSAVFDPSVAWGLKEAWDKEPGTETASSKDRRAREAALGPGGSSAKEGSPGALWREPNGAGGRSGC